MKPHNNQGDEIHSGRMMQEVHPSQLAQYEPRMERAREEEDEGEIDLRELWQVIVRRRKLIMTLVAAGFIISLLISFLTTPIYRSSTTLQINQESAKIVEYQDVTGERVSDSREFYLTQHELLKSRTLAKRVVDDLGLIRDKAKEEGGSFFKDLFSGAGNFLTGNDQGKADEGNQQQDEDAAQQRLLDAFLTRLTISPVKNSRLVGIHYDSPDPKLAAEIVNGVAKNFIDLSLERRLKASSYAKTFLSEQIKQVRANLEDSESRLTQYAKERDIVDLEKKMKIYMDELNGLNTKIIDAQSGRIKAEADFREMRAGKGGGFKAVMDSKVIEEYKKTLAQLEAEYQQKLGVFKPAYPEMVQLKSRIDTLKGKVDEEVGKIQSSIQSEYQSATRQEASIKARMSELQNEILDLKSRTADYLTLQRDVDTNRELYNGLVQRVKEVGVASGIGENNISIVDAGEVPLAPIKPKKTLNVALGIILGLFAGIGLAFLFEFLDDTVKSSQDVEKISGLATLGIIPLIDLEAEGIKAVGMMSSEQPKSAFAEAYRSCRTALSFSTSKGAPKLLHITSSAANEGKTSTAMNLAIAFGQTGGSVLLIDSDLRNPSLHKEFFVPNYEGLTNYLIGEKDPFELPMETNLSNVSLIVAGPIPPNPAELLSTGRMMEFLDMATQKYDYVIVDGPPVLGLADALVLANMVKATLLVVNAGVTRKAALEGALKRLRSARSNILGTVLSKYGQGAGGYGYDYHYSYNYYNYSHEEQPQKRLGS